jgi:dTDP-4-amino-4,6-dideoxygalactose transaminase
MEKIDFASHEAPDLDIFSGLLQEVWQSNIHTNNGPMVKKFENLISQNFESDSFVAVNNGTLAIEIALRVLKAHYPKKHLVLTTSFTYIATVAAIKNSGLELYYVDIDENYLGMSPIDLKDVLESQIDVNEVLAILPVHPFNNLADVGLISEIAQKYDIPVVYDASHSIGSKINNRQSTSFGTFSTVSFHATKTLSTSEGGGLFVNDPKYVESVQNFRAFGFSKDGEFKLLGTNGKMSELHAIHGIASLSNFDKNVQIRKQIFHGFNVHLKSDFHSTVPINANMKSNFGYFPIISKDQAARELLEKKLIHSNIGFRRYFYPSLNFLVPADGRIQNSINIADKISCLPFRANLSVEEIEKIQLFLDEL